ncbi:MAG: universal stress protein [Candidatus Bathyarchaeota archaeon]|nr:universal stress protein [Candidatus Bathyarchaeota archaeon]
MLSNILVAVDGSANSERALDFALDLAEKYGSKITVLNVSESSAIGMVPQEPPAYSGATTAVFAKDMRRFHVEILNKALTHAAEVKPGLKVSSKLREGEPAAEIVAEAKEGGFDAVVVGHVGVGRVREFLGLGGISDKVAHSAPCPVIIVR